MARDTLTIQQIGGAGAQKDEDLAYTAAVAANNMQVKNDGRVLLLVKNGGAGSQDITITSVSSIYGRTGDITLSTTNAKESIAGPFPAHLWTQSDGYLYIEISDEDTLSVAAIRLPDYVG